MNTNDIDEMDNIAPEMGTNDIDEIENTAPEIDTNDIDEIEILLQKWTLMTLMK